MADQYKSIQGAVEDEFKDRGSKFIAYLFPIKSEADFVSQSNELKAGHPKARHFCPAFRLTDGTFRSSDDGEPSGSAGKPILNQLLSKELEDVGCIVVRYFGGTKLGVPGLINAYKSATKLAIEKAVVVTKYHTKEIKIGLDYSCLGRLMDCLKRLDLDISKKALNAEAVLYVKVPRSSVDLTITKIKACYLNRSVADVKEDDELEGISFELIVNSSSS